MTIRNWLRGTVVVWLASIVLVAMMTRVGRTGSSEEARSFEWAGAAADLERIELRGSAGTFRIIAGQSDNISVRVTVRPDPSKPSSIFSRSDPADLSNARVSPRHHDRSLHLEIEGASSGRRVEEWTVEVPERFAASVRAGNGEVEVRGLRGGVEATANAGRNSRPGRIDIDVQAGSVQAKLGVGKVTVRTASRDLGDVRLSSSVGKTELWIDGLQLERRDPPGSGSQVRLDGAGEDVIEAKVSVGDAAVHIR